MAIVSLNRRDSCNPNFENCNSMSYGTRAGIGFLIFAIIFILLFALGVNRRRRAQRAFVAHQNLVSQGVALHPSHGTPGVGVWSQHLAGGPAAPNQAYLGGGAYAPGYMAPPPGPPPPQDSMYAPPPKYDGPADDKNAQQQSRQVQPGTYQPPAGPPPGHATSPSAMPEPQPYRVDNV